MTEEKTLRISDGGYRIEKMENGDRRPRELRIENIELRMKSEILNSKLETISKYECSKFKTYGSFPESMFVFVLRIWILVFRICFVFRYSIFEFQISLIRSIKRTIKEREMGFRVRGPVSGFRSPVPIIDIMLYFT